MQKRADKLKIKCYHGVENKLLKFQELCKDYRLNEVAFVGNDINDIVLLEKVGVSVAVNDAYEPVKKICNIILKKNGGEGAVREFCEMVYKAKEEI
ncbi:MAG: hypothetical protein C0601_12735 [Candidatus Muiribacterium halophilum]|uniref:3-deoxy-D-manno-octulosonate 8-phosphate phosphatase n=1 Tax=Muiribacterium halophilum TaxID=2053465 RepID=A0A2N5ZA18_MUIH1|nr:MAG: hypothetical protein C0601_12735 [Candidatus Muirbacterium halophilum]